MPSQTIKKRDVTRQKVIEATINCIANEGYHAAHTNRIAEQAEVSWGVIQYHFGDKNSLILETLEYCFEIFNHKLNRLNLCDINLQARINTLIDCVWALMKQNDYICSIDILRNNRVGELEEQSRSYLQQWAETVDNCWLKLFEQLPELPVNHRGVKKMIFACLRGLIDTVNPRNPDSEEMKKAILALKQSAYMLLTAE